MDPHPRRHSHRQALRRITARQPLRGWAPDVVDLPWADPAFSERMLREHLNQSHDLASRRMETIDRQVELLTKWLGIRAGETLLDLTCGPGLVARAFARNGVAVTGVDVAPAAIRHAREITEGMDCSFIEGDMRTVELPDCAFDAAIYLYGQCEVPRPEELPGILSSLRRALRPGAPLAVEARVASSIPHTSGTAWHTAANGLFGPGLQLVLTERGWDADASATVERHHVLAVDSGEITVVGATARAIERETMESLLADAGFAKVEFHPGWDGLAFDASADWLVAVGR